MKNVNVRTSKTYKIHIHCAVRAGRRTVILNKILVTYVKQKLLRNGERCTKVLTFARPNAVAKHRYRLRQTDGLNDDA